MTAAAPYTLALCRPRTAVVWSADGQVQADVMSANLDEFCDLIGRAAAEHGAKLVVFPQFGLTGYGMVDNAGWIAGSVEIDGPELQRIGAAAKAAGVHVALQAAERHADFPGRYFLSAFLIKPDGAVGLAYRKNYTFSLRTSPNDVRDRFVEVFGEDGFYPVLDTPLGRIGLLIGAEVHFPEAVRSLALKGAEVILNPIAGSALDYMGRAGALNVRAVRAFENMVYLGMTNIHAEGAPPPQAFDWDGAEIGQPVDGGDLFTLATIDLGALSAARAKPAVNFLAQLQPIHEDRLGLDLWPANIFPDTPPTSREPQVQAERESFARLQASWKR